ncbi:MAG: LytTR family transcriptional regulator DNA-binding domain-containing protein [Bacteroidota bacterium]
MPITSIAILPFDNLSPEAGADYLSDGIAEEIMVTFARFEGIRVASRTSAFYFKRREASVEEIGQKLNVDHLLEGSIKLFGNRIRVNVQLVSTHSGFSLWTESYDRTLDDLLDLQIEISEWVFQKFLQQNAHLTAVPSALRSDISPRAYEHYLKGRYHFNSYTMSHFRKAIDCYQMALDIQADFAAAMAAQAICYVGLGGYVDTAYYQKGKEAALSAMAMNDQLLDSYIALGYIQMFHDRDWMAARASLLQAVAINNQSAEAHRAYGVFLMLSEEPQSAIYEHELALKYDPLNTVILNGLGIINATIGKYERAQEVYEQILSLDKEFYPVFESLAWLHTYQGRWAEAIPFFRRYREAVNDPLKGQMGLGYALARSGQSQEAYNLLASLDQRQAKYPNESIALDYATIYMGLKQTEKVFFYLQKSVKDKFILTNFALICDPTFQPLRQDKRFEELLNQTGYFYYQKNKQQAHTNKDSLLQIQADTKEQLNLLASQLLYIEAKGNYADFIYREGGELQHKLLRLSLADAKTQIDHPHIVQCHRSYLVNLAQFESLEGNAKKYELRSPWLPHGIPVSRSQGNTLKAHLKTLQ